MDLQPPGGKSSDPPPDPPWVRAWMEHMYEGTKRVVAASTEKHVTRYHTAILLYHYILQLLE